MCISDTGTLPCLLPCFHGLGRLLCRAMDLCHGVQALGLEKKVRAAEMSVLNRYGVMADLSALKEEQLDQALKGRVPVKMAPDMTFASWCDQLLGQNVRVPVARFEDPVPGKTKLSKLAVARDLSKSFKARDRQLQAALNEAENRVDQLKAEIKTLKQGSARAEPVTPVSRISESLRFWYCTTSDALQKILDETKEVEGHICSYQGQLNRDYRKRLFEVVLLALSDLESIGFSINAHMHDNSKKEPVSPPLILHRGQVPDADEVDVKRFDFVINDIQIDGFEEARQSLSLWQPQPTADPARRFNCHVQVTASQQLDLDEEELSHLSYFMHKLFESIARSGDSKKRGSLIEKLVLCQLLSFTAPCMQSRSQQGLRPIVSEDRTASSDVPAGVIVDHLLQVLRGSIWR